MVLLAPAAAALAVAAAAGAPLPGWVLPAALGTTLGLLAAILIRHAALRERRDFVAAVSHDLRTPLAQIRLLTESLALEREADAESRARWISTVAREAQVLDDRIANLLLVAHGDGLGGAPRTAVDVAALAEDLAAEYAPIVVGHEMTLRVETEPGLRLSAEARLLRLALAALLDNACRYGPRGQTILLRAQCVASVIRLSVADEGPGIPEADRERVWRPFIGLGNGRGAGLGLAVVERVAHAHGGVARVEPSERGARVCLELPLD